MSYFTHVYVVPKCGWMFIRLSASRCCYYKGKIFSWQLVYMLLFQLLNVRLSDGLDVAISIVKC